jgi:hypothetical protein
MSHGRKQPRQPRWPANPRAHESTCHKLRTFNTEEAAELSNETRIAWFHLTNGSGTTAHFDTVANSLNSALMMCEPISQEAVDVVIRAQLSAVAMQSRYHRTGTFGADADALAYVPDGLDLYDQLLTFSNPLQLVLAVKNSWKRIEDGDVLASVGPRLDLPAWQYLTDAELLEIYDHENFGLFCDLEEFRDIAKVIEAQAKRRNT